MTEDERYMQLALHLAEMGRGQTSPNPMVGAVIVNNGEIVGQGAHLKAGQPHAEIHALRMAGEAARGATAYVTLEPCSHHGRTPPCADALVAAGVARVVFAVSDPNPAVNGRGAARLREAGIVVTAGVLEEEAQRQNEAFWVYMSDNRPFVIWKCAATLDGYIAADSGHSNYVTSEASRLSVQQLRRQVAAIGVGVETVLRDNPRLTVRIDTPSRQPVRVVFDSRLRIPITSDLLTQPGETVIYTTEAGYRAAGREYVGGLSRAGATVVAVSPDEAGKVYLPEALSDLAKKGISSLLVEGGSTLVSALIRERMVDKVLYYIAPKLLRSGIRAVKGERTERMVEAMSLDRVSYEQIGPDLLVSGYPRYDEMPRWWLGRV